MRRITPTTNTSPGTNPPASAAPASPGQRPPKPLSAVQQTLVIPLVARALGAQIYPSHDCGDLWAKHLLERLERLGIPGQQYLADRPTVLNVLWRTGLIRRILQDFFAQHPNAWGLNLGCGLSHYFQWIDNGSNTWIDGDLPEVMALRKTLIDARPPRLRHVSVNLQNPDWWQRLRLPKRSLTQPLLLLCEGVLMYLPPDEVRQAIGQFAQYAPPGSRLVLDTMARCAIGQAQWHASVGQTEAQFHWGISQMQELTACHPRLQLLHTHSVAPSHGWMGVAMEAFWNPWGQAAPLYGLAELEVGAWE